MGVKTAIFQIENMFFFSISALQYHLSICLLVHQNKEDEKGKDYNHDYMMIRKGYVCIMYMYTNFIHSTSKNINEKNK